MRVGILTLSDKGAVGAREDVSGQVIRELIEKIDGEVLLYEILPDDRATIEKKLLSWVDEENLELILTTGGTGLGPRDVTPDATLAVIEFQVPGMAEAMRFEGMKKTPHAMLSRAVVGVRKRTLIVNLPGSPKAVRENLEAILPALPHGIAILRGRTGECGSL
ncbi:MAG TPA: molybdenum cofactor biosynthesis protein [Cyanobacteria bacterium UBA8530]|nr:molybdenum cofactor biosynthesis protein [Cyanobacteria bacterium UBA8530]